MWMAAWRTVSTSESGGRPCRQVSPLRLWLFFAFTQHKQWPYTVHIHADLGGDGLRWRPLNVAVATAERRDAGGELPGGGDGGIQLRPNDGGTPSSAGGEQWWCGGGGFCMALDSKLCDHIHFRIRPLPYLIR
jgi:hypothetical protein